MIDLSATDNSNMDVIRGGKRGRQADTHTYIAGQMTCTLNMELQTNMRDSRAFHPGQLVQLKSQPNSCGAVLSANDSGPEIQNVY